VLLCGTVYVILCLDMSVEHLLVTDRHTTTDIPRAASMALCGKTVVFWTTMYYRHCATSGHRRYIGCISSSHRIK